MARKKNTNSGGGNRESGHLYKEKLGKQAMFGLIDHMHQEMIRIK